MKKFFRLGKRMLALFIIALLNINSYAAVSANDGSAFVTKAEFDALVNTFNEQMDAYQAGLNSKIDGAIANYLAGLSSQTTLQLDDYLKNGYNNNVNNVSFFRFSLQCWKRGQDEHDISLLLYYSYTCGSGEPGQQSSGRYTGWTILHNGDSWTRGGYMKYPYNPADTNANYHDLKYYINLYDKNDPNKGFYFEDYNLYRCKFKSSSEAAPYDGNARTSAPGNFSPGRITIDCVLNEAGNKEVGSYSMGNLSITPANWIGHEWVDDPNFTKNSQEWMKYMNADYVIDTPSGTAANSIYGVSYAEKNTYDGNETTIDSMAYQAPSTGTAGNRPLPAAGTGKAASCGRYAAPAFSCSCSEDPFPRPGILQSSAASSWLAFL